MKFRVIGFVLASGIALAQSPTPDRAAYLSFFTEALRHGDTPTSTYNGTLNGEPVGQITQVSLADLIGISAEQARALVQLASFCSGDVARVDARISALTFESRLAAANDEKPPAVLNEQLASLSARRVEMITGYIARLRESLGPEAFGRVDSYVRSGGSPGKKKL